MKEREYYQKIDKLDDSNFLPLGAKPMCNQANLSTLATNLIGMFSKRPTLETLAKLTDNQKHDTLGCSINDYAWTKEVEEQFYSHSNHAEHVKKFKKNEAMSWGMFVLNHTPVTL